MTICRFDTIDLFIKHCLPAFVKNWHQTKPLSLQNEGGAMDVCLKKDKAKKGGLKKKSNKSAESNKNNDFPLTCLPIIEPNKVIIFLNLRTYSEAQTIAVKKKNGKYTTEHWTAKHKRHKKQKSLVFWSYMEVRQFVKYPCTITFVRYAPKMLDAHDNLPMSFKWICDALAAEITGEHRPGLADNFEGLTIKYDQVKSKQYGVKIIIEF